MAETPALINPNPTFGSPLANLANDATDVALPLATETVITALPPIPIVGANTRVSILATALITTGVGATTVTLRIRRGDLTGAVVGEVIAQSSPASSTILAAVGGADSPGPSLAQGYVITATAAGAAGTSLHTTTLLVLG